jgi:hypothetical protein
MTSFSNFNISTIFLVLSLISFANGQDRRPTISFITQPEIVTDIGGTVEMECSVQVRHIQDKKVLGYKYG